jgi:acetyl esterase
MGVTLHPDMAIIQEAQKGAYGGKTIAEQRADWSRYTASLAIPRPAEILTRDIALPVPGHAVPVRVYRHARAAGATGCVIYMHGGGFMKGDLDSSDPIAWGFCAETGATVISVDYRLTPEHPFPAAFDDCLGTLRHVAGHAAEFGIDPARIAMVGDSAGGHLAASVCLAARDAGGPAIAAQAVIYTVIGTDMTMPSYEQNATGFGLTTASCHNYMKLLLPGAAHTANPYARPALARDFSRLPPAFVHSAEYDPVRDDGRFYAAQLALAGVDVTYREARGMIHGFMRARFKGAGAKAEYDAICDFLRVHIGQDVAR